MQLGFDLFLQENFSVSEDLLIVTAKGARLRIDDLEFFLDAKSKNVIAFATALTRAALEMRAGVLPGGSVHKQVVHATMVVLRLVRGSTPIAIYCPFLAACPRFAEGKV